MTSKVRPPSWDKFCKALKRKGYVMKNKSGSIRNFVKDTSSPLIQAHMPHGGFKTVNEIDLKKAYRAFDMTRKQFIEYCNSMK